MVFSIYGKRPSPGRFSWLDILRYRSVSSVPFSLWNVKEVFTT